MVKKIQARTSGMFWEEGKGIAAVEDREHSEIPSLGKEHPDLKKKY